jgi:hypothetical protein
MTLLNPTGTPFRILDDGRQIRVAIHQTEARTEPKHEPNIDRVQVAYPTYDNLWLRIQQRRPGMPMLGSGERCVAGAIIRSDVVAGAITVSDVKLTRGLGSW